MPEFIKPDPIRPGGPLEESSLFEEKVVGGKTTGFRDPDGNSYFFNNGEELVHIKNSTGGRNTFIRVNGEDIPFETWKSQYGK